MFNYARLRGRIKEVFGTQEAFAEKLGISKASLSNKLNNHVDFGQKTIADAVKLLDIPPEEIESYFFKQKVQ